MNKLEFYGFNSYDIYYIDYSLKRPVTALPHSFPYSDKTGCTALRGSDNDILDETGLYFSEPLSDPENSFPFDDFRGLELRILDIDDSDYLEVKNCPIIVHVKLLDDIINNRKEYDLVFNSPEDLNAIKKVSYYE